MKTGYLVYDKYKDLFYEMYNVKPIINYPQCGKLISKLMKEDGLTEDILCKIVEIYFAEEPPGKVFHLPWILAAASINKYLPRIEKIGKSIYNI